MRFRDRVEAGRQLAEALDELDLQSPVVLALPRGGVPVAFQIAERFRAPLGVLVVRKVGAPMHPEYGIGAVAEGGEQVVDHVAMTMLGITEADFEKLAERERAELERRVREYRGDRPPLPVEGHDVVLVDDGLATGVTAMAALRAVRRRRPRRLILAIPACAPDSADRLRSLADQVVCLIAPEYFRAVGQWYHEFGQTSDDEVRDLLARNEAARRSHA